MEAIPALSATSSSRKRTAYIDNIRTTMIAMVVLMHACVTYSGLGSWFYTESVTLDLASGLVFYVYQIFTQSFFMGLLFFIAASFVPSAYDRKGFRRFVADRAIRLGLPSLAFMLLLDPLTNFIRELGFGHVYSLSPWIDGWVSNLANGDFLSNSGPLWFAVALLVFSLVYALVRLIGDRFSARSGVPAERRPLSDRSVHLGAVALLVGIALGSFLVRLIQPIGTSWANMQLGYFPQYLILFALGLWAGRSDFLNRLPRSVGIAWLKLAFALGFPAWFLLMALGGAFSGNEAAFVGGWHWQAAAFAFWEAFFGVAACLGLLALYREKANVGTKTTGLLSDSCFGIYLFHAPVLVGVSMLMRTAAFHPLAKALVAAALAWIVSLGIAWIVRRVPGLRRIVM